MIHLEIGSDSGMLIGVGPGRAESVSSLSWWPWAARVASHIDTREWEADGDGRS
jgi:hypothetical protein